MQTVEKNRAAFNAYVEKIGRHIDAYQGVNPFWAKIYANAGAGDLTGSPEQVVERINRAPMAGYLVQPLSAETCAAKWTKVGWALDALDRDGVRAKMPRGVTIEVAFAAWFLRANGQLDDAKRVLCEARLPPNYNVLKHTFYARQIKDAAGDGPLDVLEIGAGGSALKVVLRAIMGDRIRSYTIVDLAQMLCLSIAAALAYFPEERISIGAEEMAEAAHTFIPAADAPSLIDRPRRYSVALNTHSFQEMDAGVIASYFDLIYATAAPGALFFNTNWAPPAMTRLDGTPYNNDPALYPYRSDDLALYDGPDPVHQALRERFGFKAKMPSRTSIRRINRAA